MPKIDVASIAGFSDMTPEQQVKALLDVEIPEAFDRSAYVPKAMFDQTASELSNTKKQLKGRMTEEEQAQAERLASEQEQAQRYSDLESKYNALMRQSTINDIKAKYIASGYSSELAEKAAIASVDGKTEEVLKALSEFIKAHDDKLRAEILSDPKGPSGFGAKPGEAEAENVRIAREIGENRAKAAQNTTDALSRYKGK